MRCNRLRQRVGSGREERMSLDAILGFVAGVYVYAIVLAATALYGQFKKPAREE